MIDFHVQSKNKLPNEIERQQSQTIYVLLSIWIKSKFEIFNIYVGVSLINKWMHTRVWLTITSCIGTGWKS